MQTQALLAHNVGSGVSLGACLGNSAVLKMLLYDIQSPHHGAEDEHLQQMHAMT